MDLAQGYLQLAIELSSRRLIAFRTATGTYQFTRLPFGLRNACAIFNRTLRAAELDAGLGDIVAGYFDDLTVHTSSPDPAIHIRELARVFQFLDIHQLKLNWKKCTFGETAIQVLGHVVDARGLSVDSTKLQGVAALEPPTTKKGLQSFIGFANYYRAFVRNFSEIAAPLTALAALGTRGSDDVTTQWTTEHQSAFDDIKCLLLSTAVLKLFDYTDSRTLRLETDASNVGIGAILYQQDAAGVYRPVAYLSRKLSKAEMNYNVTERELLAIVFGVSKLATYLASHECEVFTDHGALKHLLNSSTLPSARLTRWMVALSAFQLTIFYRPGALNDAADGLSRLPSSAVTASVHLVLLERPAEFLAFAPINDPEEILEKDLSIYATQMADMAPGVFPIEAITSAPRDAPTFMLTRRAAKATVLRESVPPGTLADSPRPPSPGVTAAATSEVAPVIPIQAAAGPMMAATGSVALMGESVAHTQSNDLAHTQSNALPATTSPGGPAVLPEAANLPGNLLEPAIVAGTSELADVTLDVPPATMERMVRSTIILPPRPTAAEEEQEARRKAEYHSKQDPYRNRDLMAWIVTGHHSALMGNRSSAERTALEKIARPYRRLDTGDVIYEEKGESPLRRIWTLPTPDQRQELIRRAHALGHFGIAATVSRLRDVPFFASYWPGMQIDVTNYVRECTTCLQYSSAPPMQPPATSSHVPGLFDEVAIDLVTGLPVTPAGFNGVFVT